MQHHTRGQRGGTGELKDQIVPKNGVSHHKLHRTQSGMRYVFGQVCQELIEGKLLLRRA